MAGVAIVRTLSQGMSPDSRRIAAQKKLSSSVRLTTDLNFALVGALSRRYLPEYQPHVRLILDSLTGG